MALGNPKWHFFEDYKTIENFGLIKWDLGMVDGVQPKRILIMGGWARVCVLGTPPNDAWIARPLFWIRPWQWSLVSYF